MPMDITFKVDGIKGESGVKGHTEEIDVLAWSWGVAQSGSFHGGGGGGSGKANFHDLSFTKYIDKASPELLLACSNGKHIKSAVLTMRKAGEKPLDYLTITLEDLLVSSVSTGGSGGEDRLTENVTLNFAKVKFEYQEQDPKGGPKGGKVVYGWNIKEGAKLA